MAEYSQVQTYVRCNNENFVDVLKIYIKALLELGFEEEFLNENFQGQEWGICDNGFMYLGKSTEFVEITINNTQINIRPHIMGWTPDALTNLSEPWLEISLIFLTEEIVENFETYKIKPHIENVIWKCMLVVSNYFNEVGTYFTDELSDGRPWEAIVGDEDAIWQFDAAIIPKEYKSVYVDLPNMFEQIIYGDKIYIVNKEVWSNLPQDKITL